MKAFIICLMCLTCSVTTQGQNQKGLNGATITPPKFIGIPGSMSATQEQEFQSIDDYMKTHVSYPAEALKRYKYGTEVIGFTVTPQGEVSDISIINSVASEIDEAVIAVLKTTSCMWKPGYINEEAVEMEKEISVVFKLEEQSVTEFVERARVDFTRACEMLLLKQKPRQALKYFDRGIMLLPKDRTLLALRGLTRYDTGDKEGAIRDWTRIKQLGGTEGEEYMQQLRTLNGYEDLLITMKGYEEMSAFLSK